MATGNRFRALLDLCKRRGFLFSSAEIYGGLRGAYDYGPLGVELKKNLANEWWNQSVYQRDDVFALDTSIITPYKVLKASGHVDEFTDELVDCLLSKERFRPDKAPTLTLSKNKDYVPLDAPDKQTAKKWESQIKVQLAPGALIKREGRRLQVKLREFVEPTFSSDGQLLKAGSLQLATETENTVTLPYHGYVEPNSNSPFLTPSRPFNLMFKTFLDPVDPIDRVIDTTSRSLTQDSQSSAQTLRANVDEVLRPSTVFLRPETAQGVFINFHNILRTMRTRPPFGIAQMGKSFRNEIRLEHAIFRTPEFEQMELEYFTAPWESSYWFDYWKNNRLTWWLTYANTPSKFRTRPHENHELAHYARGCMDVEYEFPWGWGEVEGVAHRGDYDLRQHSQSSNEHLEFLDDKPQPNPRIPSDVVQTQDIPATPTIYIPHVIEASCGLNRALLAFLDDAFTEVTTDGPREGPRIILKLHPRLAPLKVAIMPLIPKPELTPYVQRLASAFRARRIPIAVETQNLKIGKRYYRHDEIGTPFCVTIDFDTPNDKKVTIRMRDTGEQIRIHIGEVVSWIQSAIDT